MNQPEFQALLQTDDIFCAHRIGSPQRLVKIFAVPAAEFSSTVIDKIEGPQGIDDALDLAKFAYVATSIQRLVHVSSNGEPDLVRLVGNVAGDHMMTSC